MPTNNGSGSSLSVDPGAAVSQIALWEGPLPNLPQIEPGRLVLSESGTVRLNVAEGQVRILPVIDAAGNVVDADGNPISAEDLMWIQLPAREGGEGDGEVRILPAFDGPGTDGEVRILPVFDASGNVVDADGNPISDEDLMWIQLPVWDGGEGEVHILPAKDGDAVVNNLGMLPPGVLPTGSDLPIQISPYRGGVFMGYTFEINPETGEVVFRNADGYVVPALEGGPDADILINFAEIMLNGISLVGVTEVIESFVQG
ncbi:MAG TPA: hypothetical protein VEB20_08545 [Azospirillaceae bacterium]|nr:hypothetical protein [Azospirillaceae bacterium]